jgi:NAD(P)-dependent dehydrogenase (short-subunit alcohol dehydrogenase family)
VIQRAQFGPQTTTTEVLAGIDLTGRQAILTGGTSGLGREAARALAAAGAAVLFTVRDGAKGEAVAKATREETGNAAVESAVLDLTSVEQVTAFAEAARRRFPKLDMLILNAAIMTPNLERNEQGIESQFMTAYVGHLILAATFAPSLIAAAPSRIISLSSSGHKQAPVDFEDVNFDRRPYEGLASYGQAKTAAALLAIALNDRLASKGVLAFAVHPGVILETNLSRYVGGMANEQEQIKKYGVPASALKSLQAGAATTVWAATSPDLAASGGGKYLEDCHISEPSEDGGSYSGVLPYAVDSADADRLWALTEKLIGRSLVI